MNGERRDHSPRRTSKLVREITAFTLMEVIAVIAIMAVLLAILLPSVHAVREAANKARTRVQFNQWAVAIAGFRSEYGYYPSFDNSGTINGGADTVDHPFHDVLAGRRRDGSRLVPGSAVAWQNRKSISFYSFPESDFADASASAPGLLCDAFGTTDIVVLVDRNLDGTINGADYGESLPASRGIRPSVTDFPTAGVRAGVVFYVSLPSATSTAPHFIFSWRSR